jgi:hypothetical protein
MKTRLSPGVALYRRVRRWRLGRPHCGGWWEYRECGGRRVEKILLIPCGQEVVGDDEWEQATGRKAEHDGFVENYWDGTATTQNEMPGLWRQLPPN